RPLPATPNTFILPGRYTELPETENSFWVKQNKIYLAAAASGKDTSLMLIQVGTDSIFQQRISSNTSLTSTSSQYLSDFDLGQIVFYFDNKTDSSSKELTKTNKDTQVEIESEKSNTIAMAFKELESQKVKNNNKDLETKEFSGELKVILNYDFDDTQ